ncbi:MAG: hypothetical protein RQ853_01885 [Acidianus sp.]|jgi:outer membrane translocation and assembly module TamA|nr:hypothetical protein [Acidianus sp.]
MIRIRSLDIKGFVNETYELLRGGEWDRLGRDDFLSPQRGSHGTMWSEPSKGFGGDSERRVTRAGRKACNF